MNDTVIIGRCDELILRFLASLSYSIELLSDNCKVDRRISNHADLSVFKLDEQTFIVESTQKRVIKILQKSKYTVLSTDMKEKAEYPDDCVLNFAVIGKHIVGSRKALTNVLSEAICRENYRFINVSQGYAKCSMIPVSNSAAITDDESIFNSLCSNGIECLRVQKGFVKLSGFDYGFIGGASMIDNEKRKVIFFGDITAHPDYAEINAFLSKYKYSIEYMPGKPLTDVGGAIII